MDEDKTKNGGYESEGNPLVGLIREKFQQAETSKIYDERRWFAKLLHRLRDPCFLPY